MKQKTAIVKNIKGRFKAVDKDGNVRILKVGDFIYEGEEVSSIHEQDGGLSDSIAIENINTDSSEFFVLIQDLRDSEMYLIPQGGYRFFDLEDMGRDETRMARGQFSYTPTEEIDSGHGSGFLQNNNLVPMEELFSDSKQREDSRDTTDDEKPERPQTPEPEPQPEPEPNPEPQPQPQPDPGPTPSPDPTPEPPQPQPDPEPQPDPNPQPDPQPQPEPQPEPNHSPVITGGDTTGNVTEITDNAPGENTTTHTATGSLTFTDTNLSDTHTVSSAPTGSGYLGTFIPSIDTATGKINWNFSVEDSALDYLKEGQTLTQTYTITVDDGHGGTATEDVTVTIVGSNDAPAPQPDTGSVSENSPSTTGTVMGNDSDVDGDTLTVTGVNGSALGTSVPTEYGTITLNPDGSYSYTADTSNSAVSGLDNGETLTDTITYTVDDGNGGTATTTLTITINGYTPPPPPNNAPVFSPGGDTGSITEIVDNAPGENTVTHTTSGTLIFTDADAGDTHTATSAPKAGGYVGTFTPTVDDATGTVNWEFTVPDADIDGLREGEVLTQVYTVTVDDGHGGTATEDVTVTITGRNDGPDAKADSPVAVAGVNASGNVLANDIDVDGDDISVTAFTVDGNTVPSTVGTPYTIMKGTETAGVLTLNSDGTYEFVADSNFHGTVPDITYTVTDTHGATDTALLKISVIDNSAPLIDLNSAASLTDPDTAWAATYTEDGPAVSIADTDMGINTNGGAQIQRAIITLTNTKPGDVLDSSGIDTTKFTVTPSTSGDDTILTITPVGGGTLPKADFEDAIKAVTFKNTSDNPDLSDRVIEVQVNDNNSDSNVAISTITVQAANDAPTINAGNDTGTVTEAGHLDDGTVVPGTNTVSDTLTATDPDTGATQTWSVAGTSQYGSMAIDPNTGQWTYTLDNDNPATQALREGEIKTETFTATVTDSAGATDTRTITVTINGTNDAPVITSDAAAAQGSVTEDAAANTATGTLTSSDVDVDTTAVNHGATWSLDTTNGTYGSITLDADTGEWTYTLDNSKPATQALEAGETQTETFTATVTDDKGAATTKTITVTVGGVNDAPTIDLDGTATGTGYTKVFPEANVAAGVSIAAANMDIGDVDTANLQKITVQLTNAQTGDELLTGSVDSTKFDITNNGTTITLTAKAGQTPTHAEFENAVKAVKFKNAETNPDDTPRTISVTVDDGQAANHVSNTAIATLEIDKLPVPANDTENVTENRDDSTTQSVSGNLLANDDLGNNPSGEPTTLDSVTYTDTGGSSQTVTITADNTSLDTKYGTLVVSKNGDYTFTPDANLTHPADGNDLQETFTYTIKDHDKPGDATDDDISSTSATVTINIADGAGPTITSPTDEVWEKNLDHGSDPNPPALTQTGSFGVTRGTDDFDVKFDVIADQTALNALNLKSGGVPLTYSRSADGHTLTAKVGTETVFTVEITNPEDVSAGYKFILAKPLDNTAAGNEPQLPFAITVKDDDDGDRAASTLTVTVHDDNTGTEKAISVTEDGSHTFTTNADATPANTQINGQSAPSWVNTAHGKAKVNTNGTITYEPNGDYSGEDTFTYTTTAEGTPKQVTVTATVNPISDAPGMGGAVTVTTDEDTPVALSGDAGWTLPTITDHTDQNGATAGDNPERLGLLKLSGLTAGTIIQDGSGNTLHTANGSEITIKITDVPGYHINNPGTPTLSLTQAEFNALKILPKEHSSKDLNLTLKATEYEVGDNGNPLAGVPGASSTQNIKVTVNPITDDQNFNLVANPPAPSGNEDDAINLKDAFTFTQSVDADTSEHYTLNFSCDNSDRVELKFQNGGWQSLADFNAANHDFTGGSFPDVYIRTKGNDSRDITNLKLKLTAQDHDEDNISQTDSTIYEKEVTISSIPIIPIANDITLKEASPSGNEDTRIAMGLDFENKDSLTSTPAGQEVVDHLIISNIPTGAKIYNGTTLVFTGDGSTPYNTGALTTAEIKALTILPPQDFSGKIDLKVKVYSKDFDDDTLGNGEVTTQNPTEVTHTITVKGVVDTSATGVNQWEEGTAELTQNNGTYQGNLYVTTSANGSPVELTGDATVTTTVSGTEDGLVPLELDWKSYENKQHPTSDNSETAEFIIRAQAGETNSFTIVNGSGTAIGTEVSGGWKLTLAQLRNAHVKAQKDFSGDLNLELATTVTDGADSKTQVDKFKVQLAPQTDPPVLQLTDVFATEDTKTKFDIFPQTTDVDGSELVKTMELTNIPPGVKFFIGAGAGAMEISYTGTSLTLTIDDANPDIANSKITHAQLKELHIQAPQDSNEQFTVDVKPTVQDGTAPVATIAPKTVKVFVKGDADNPVFENPSTTSVSGDEPQAATGGLVDISDLKAHSGDTDASETLTYVLKNLPKEFLPTDATGQPIGDFISTGGTTVNWSFTQAQMNVLHIKVPQHHSGTTALTLEVIAVENDGDTATASRNFDLVIAPKVSTSDPVTHSYDIKEPVTQHANSTGGADQQTTENTFVPLVFTNTTDDETVTRVEISTVPAGVVLGIQNGGSVTPATPDVSGKYTFTGNDIDKIVAIIKGDGTKTHANDGDQLTISGIDVTVVDAKDDDPGVTAEQTINGGSITLTVEGQADQPDITGLTVQNPSQTSSYYNNVAVTTAFPDTDGSESHYYIVTAPEDVLLGSGEHQGGGNWYLTEAEMAVGFHAWFHGPAAATKDITITAYAAENTLAHDSIVATIYGDQGNDGTSTSYTAQPPSLSVTDPTPNEDSSFTLAQVVTDAHLNNNDGGTENLSIVIKGLDLSAAGPVQSIVGANQYTYDDNGTTKIAYQVASSQLANVIITPKADYSGPVNFTVEAVAYETKAANTADRVAVTSENVTVNVQPVAETELILTPQGDLAGGIDEDAIPLVTLELSNNDTSNPETFNEPGTASLSVDRGKFVDDAGTALGISLTNLTYDGTAHTFTTSNGKQVYYQPPSHDDGDFTITVTAQAKDGSSTHTDTKAITVDIRPIASGGDFTLQDGSGNAVSETEKLPVEEDGKVQLDIHSDFYDDDNSEFQTILIKNVPAGMLFYDSSNQLVGEINATEPGGNTWKLPAGSAPNGVMNGNLYIKPPLHYTDDITLTVQGVSMEGGAMGAQQNHEASFTLDITPVANGVTIFPQNAKGEEDLPIKMDLGAKLIAQEETDTVGLNHTINETYNVTITDAGDDITLFWKDGNNYRTLDNSDSTGTNYTITGLNQTQIDNLYVKVEGNRAGSFEWNVQVSSTDGTDTSAPKTATVGLVASYEYDSQTGPATGQTITIDGKTHIFAQSGNDTITGTNAVEVIDGGKGDDTLDGGGGADELYGGKGDDTIILDTNDARIDGGAGEDTLQVRNDVDFTQLAPDLIIDMEIIDLAGNGQQTIDLDKAHVEAMTDDGNTLLIRGDTGAGNEDTVNLETGWTDSGSTETIDGVAYHILENGTAHLKIEDGVNYHIA